MPPQPQQPRVCGKCGMVFQILRLYTRHMVEHSQGFDFRYRCPESDCSTRYTAKEEETVRSHLARDHGSNGRRFCCKQCSERCFTAQGFRDHWNKSHKGVVYADPEVKERETLDSRLRSQPGGSSAQGTVYQAPNQPGGIRFPMFRTLPQPGGQPTQIPNPDDDIYGAPPPQQQPSSSIAPSSQLSGSGQYQEQQYSGYVPPTSGPNEDPRQVPFTQGGRYLPPPSSQNYPQGAGLSYNVGRAQSSLGLASASASASAYGQPQQMAYTTNPYTPYQAASNPSTEYAQTQSTTYGAPAPPGGGYGSSYTTTAQGLMGSGATGPSGSQYTYDISAAGAGSSSTAPAAGQEASYGAASGSDANTGGRRAGTTRAREQESPRGSGKKHKRK